MGLHVHLDFSPTLFEPHSNSVVGLLLYLCICNHNYNTKTRTGRVKSHLPVLVVLNLFLASCFYLLDELCRIAAYDAHRRYIMRHHAVGTDNRTVADAHAGQNRSTNANPYLVLDDNGTTVCRAAVIGIRVVVDGDKVHLRSNEHTVTDGDAATVEESATLLYPASLADADVLAVIHIERAHRTGAAVSYSYQSPCL